MKKIILVLALIASAAGIYSCGSSVGEETSIERSGKKPDWIGTPTYKDDYFVFVTGEITQAKDRAFGMNQAYADGMRKLLNMMINDVKTQSSQVMRGSNVGEDDVQKYSEFAAAWISQTYTVANVQNPETYWEKTRVETPYGEKYYYDCYTRIKISKRDFDMSLTGAYESMKKRAKDGNNKTVEEAAEKLIEELKSREQ